MESTATRSVHNQKVSPLDRILLSAYNIFRVLVRAMSLNRSSFGRKIMGLINAVGAHVTRGLLRIVHPHVTVRGRDMVLAGRRGPSPAYGLDMILGRYEPEVAEWFEQIVKPGMTVMDIGAHVGFYTLLAAELVGKTGKVFAFEPEPDNFAVLSNNVTSNKYANIQLVNKAITEKDGKIELFINPQGNDRHSIYQNPRSMVAESRITVASTSIDEFLKMQGWPQVDVIKMDIEGAEPIAVEGMAGMLARSDSLKLLIEFAPELLKAAGTVPDELLAGLNEIGFRLTSLEDDGARRHLKPAHFSQFAAEVGGAANLVCEWNSNATTTRGKLLQAP